MKSSKYLAKITAQNFCPCSSKPYVDCCKPYHLGLPSLTPDALMRSRYTAFVLNLEDYLLQTWHPDTRPVALNLAEVPPIKWLGLQVKHTAILNDITATVEFIAHYKVNGKAESQHELSQFVHIEDRWYYLTGTNVKDIR